MRRLARRMGISILVGILLQFLLIFLDVILGYPLPTFILLLPGWAFGCAGRDSDHSINAVVTCWLVMLTVNCFIYAPLVYAVKWWRPFGRREVLSIRGG